MITILAISDIHGNLESIKKLCRLEVDRFDAIVVAGDIGSGAEELMKLLLQYGCPILFVLGNWDSEVSYDVDWGESFVHLHNKEHWVKHVRFIGMSGVYQNWGLHPIAVEEYEKANVLSKQQHTKEMKRRRLKHPLPWPGLSHDDQKDVDQEISQRNLQGLMQIANRGPLANTVLVSHDRVYRLHEIVPSIPLCLFGHKHEYSDTVYKGTRFINVSCLDIMDIVNGGTYAVVSIHSDMTIDCDYRSIGTVFDE
jgi:Icc-related predicted phosphoesterase